VRAVVVALGKVGLPLAVQIAGAGHDVTGCDVDPRVCDAVNAGEAPFPGEAELPDRLREAVEAGRLRARPDTEAAVAEEPELVVAVPPLVVDAAGRPDWGALDAVTGAIGAGLRAGTTVSLETTVPVGTTRERLLPRLAEASGLEPERDFWLAFSPERVSSGRVFRDLATYPKLVGGTGEESERRAVALYEGFLDAPVWGMGGAEAAELAKLAETVYRHVNIGLANELARHAAGRGIDVARVIEAASRSATSTAPGSRWADTASRSTPTSTWRATRPPGCRARRWRSTPACPPTRSACWPRSWATCPAGAC
jgi:UDP-N-acetyl-D-mannosaminuronic acid dehydrogenase